MTLADFISPELFPCLIGHALVNAIAGVHRNALLTAADKAFVTLADLCTGVLTGAGSRTVRAGGWAGISTGFIVAVLRAGFWDYLTKPWLKQG